MRNLTNDETEYTFGRNLSNDNGEILSFDLSANLPLVYTSNTDEASVIGLKGLNALGTANQVLAMDSSGTNMIFKNDSNTEYTGTAPIDISGTIISLKGLSGFTANKVIKVNSAGNALEYADDNDTNFWNLDSVSLTPKLDSYNVIIGDADNANSNNVELLVYGDMELKNTLFSTNNNQNKIDFDTTYGIDFYGFYYSPSLRSYNMSFRNNTHGSNFPYLGVSNTGDFLFHINGRGDVMIMKADATRDVLITDGDLIGNTSGNYTKNRMKDIYCRNIYAEPIEIKNGTTSSGYINLYENSTNGTGFAKLQAPASLASDITATLPSTTGTIALQSEIRTDAQIRGLFSGTPPISVSASGVISTSFTPTSTETLENKTLKSPIFTSTSGAYEKMILKDENLTHNINIFTPDLTGNINIGFPSVTGTLAITDDIPNTTDIRGLFSSAGDPITYNSSTGVIGWTNSENYVTAANVAQQIGEAENVATSTIIGSTPDRTFGNTACKSIIQGTITEVKSVLNVIPSNLQSVYIAQFKSSSLQDDNYVTMLLGKEASVNNCGLFTWQHFSDGNANNYLRIGNNDNNSITINDSGVCLGNGTTSCGKLLFAENTGDGTDKITLKPHTDAFSAFEITLPSSQGQLALKTDIANLDNVVSYSSTAPSAISFGNPTNLRDISMNTANFTITSGDKDTDCVLTIKADTDNNDETSNPVLRFNQDGDVVKGRIQLGGTGGAGSSDNNMYIQHEYNASTDVKLILGSYNEQQLHLYHDTADVFGTLNVLPTNTTNFYIQKLLASSISNGNYVEMVLGKANSVNNCSTYAYYHSSDGSTSNFLQIGMKSKETMLQLKADTNIIMNSNKVDIITPNGTDDCNLILSAGHNGGAGNSPIIVLQNTNSAGTIKKAQLFLNGADDYLVLKNLVTDSRIEMVVGTDVLGIFKGTQSEITTTTVIGSNRFKVKHVGGFNFISNPEGTQFDDDTKAGSHITYHDNATEMTFNCPNSTYRYTNSSNHRFMFNGGTRFSIFGSSNPCIQMTKTTGANYNKQGVGTTFPTEIGQWSSQTIPFLESFYIGGQSTNDSEGYFLCMNGQTTGISTPGDNEALWWLDEDSAPISAGWKISIAGAISAVSDSRTKSNVKTYKNSNFEKYKKIRTITYNRKIPKDINPKRLVKQSCINKYNEIHYGVIAEELYDLYPEIENTQDIRKRNEWNYRKDNWNKGIYEKELDEWKEKKKNYDKEKGKDDKEEFKAKPPNKEFDEEMPYKVVDYERINIISVGVIQDLIKQNEIQQKQIDQQQTIIDKLLSSNSFKEFKS